MVESDADAEAQIIQMPTLYKFLPAQLQLLQDNAETVKSHDKVKGRYKLIKAIRKQVLALPESKNLSLQEKGNLAIAVDSWFAVRTKKTGNKVKFGKTWTGRLALYEENKVMTNELKLKLYDKGKAEGKEPRNAFSYFQAAITELWDGISTKEQAAYETLAQRWNAEGVSREQKQASVHFSHWCGPLDQVRAALPIL
jgi:hypothetical protein